MHNGVALSDFRPVKYMMKKPLKVRAARSLDARAVFQLSNHPSVRAASFNSGRIGWSDHVKWFQMALSDRLHGFYVADTEGKVVGQIRFRLEEKRATVSISVDPRYRGKGVGERLYREALADFKRQHVVEEVVAIVKKLNTRSLGFFSRLGFAIDSYEWIGGQHAVVMRNKLEH